MILYQPKSKLAAATEEVRQQRTLHDLLFVDLAVITINKRLEAAKVLQLVGSEFLA